MALRHVLRLAVALIAAVTAVVSVAAPAGAWSSSDGSYSTIQTSHNGEARDVQVDSSGNIYLCGYMRGSGDVDPNRYDSTTVNEAAAGKQSSLVVKLDSSGDLVWSSLLDSSADDWMDDCALDSSGNVYVTGKFKGSMDFDDDGSAAGSRAPAGYGLVGMRERASLLGGSFHAGPAERGWRVEAVLPRTGTPL